MLFVQRKKKNEIFAFMSIYYHGNFSVVEKKFSFVFKTTRRYTDTSRTVRRVIALL